MVCHRPAVRCNIDFYRDALLASSQLVTRETIDTLVTAQTVPVIDTNY